MIPRTWDCDLTPQERQDLVGLSSQSPGLWPFGIVAGLMGLDGAVDACADPTLIAMDAADKLREVHYPVASCLPSQEDALAILMGLRLRARMAKKRRPPLQRIAKGLGMELKDAQYALRVLHAHATTPAYEALNL